MHKSFKNTIVAMLITSLLSLSSPALVQAQIIGTLASLEQVQRNADLDVVSNAFAREEVRAQLSEMGVAPEAVQARLASLTDAELRSLAQDIQSAPAGAGVIEVVGIVFIVLLILEAVGVIDIFKKFP